jgi:hypothetical protein
VSEPGPALDRGEQETLALVVGWLIASRALRIFGLGSAVAGSIFFTRSKLAERNEKIEAAENDVRSALEDLDPVARAQVLADAARSQLS